MPSLFSKGLLQYVWFCSSHPQHHWQCWLESASNYSCFSLGWWHGFVSKPQANAVILFWGPDTDFTPHLSYDWYPHRVIHTGVATHWGPNDGVCLYQGQDLQQSSLLPWVPLKMDTFIMQSMGQHSTQRSEMLASNNLAPSSLWYGMPEETIFLDSEGLSLPDLKHCTPKYSNNVVCPQNLVRLISCTLGCECPNKTSMNQPLMTAWFYLLDTVEVMNQWDAFWMFRQSRCIQIILSWRQDGKHRPGGYANGRLCHMDANFFLTLFSDQNRNEHIY